MSLRVVAGEAGGRRLATPPGQGTRPTTDRVRQAVFNALDSLGAVSGARVLDAFAGSGALGIEALSRGAASAVFADTDRAARAAVTDNLRATGLADRAEVRSTPAEAALASGGPWDLVLLDPPYAYDGWPDLLAALEPHLADGATVVVESDREVPIAPPWGFVRVKRYGGTVVAFVRPSGAAR